MQVASELCKFGSRAVFLPFLFFVHCSFIVVVELFTNLLVLGLDVVQVLLASVEVVLILARVEAAVTERLGCLLTISE